MFGQLSFAVIVGVLLESGCSHGSVGAASAWHQTAHSREALDPTANVSTIERTAARNTSMLTHHRARHGPALAKAGAQIPKGFAHPFPGRRGG